MRRVVILLLSLLALAQPATARERVVIEETVEVTEYVDEGGSDAAATKLELARA